MLQHRGGPCVPTAHAVKEMQMGIAIAGGHQAGHQGMRLPMQAKPNFPEISGGGEKLLDLSDLSDRAIQGQTQHIVVPAIVRIRNNIGPAPATEILCDFFRDGHIVRHGVGMPLARFKNCKELSRKNRKTL
jgi:hypothetical protein